MKAICNSDTVQRPACGIRPEIHQQPLHQDKTPKGKKVSFEDEEPDHRSEAQVVALPTELIALPTEQRIAQKRKEKADKEAGVERKKQKQPLEQHFDDCGSDLSGMHGVTTAAEEVWSFADWEHEHNVEGPQLDIDAIVEESLLVDVMCPAMDSSTDFTWTTFRELLDTMPKNMQVEVVEPFWRQRNHDRNLDQKTHGWRQEL